MVGTLPLSKLINLKGRGANMNGQIVTLGMVGAGAVIFEREFTVFIAMLAAPLQLLTGG